MIVSRTKRLIFYRKKRIIFWRKKQIILWRKRWMILPFYPTSLLTLPFYSSFLSNHIIHFPDWCVIFFCFQIEHVGELMLRCMPFFPTSLITPPFYYIYHRNFMRTLGFGETTLAQSFSFLAPLAQSRLSVTTSPQSLLFLTPLAQSLLFLVYLA